MDPIYKSVSTNIRALFHVSDLVEMLYETVLMETLLGRFEEATLCIHKDGSKHLYPVNKMSLNTCFVVVVIPGPHHSSAANLVFKNLSRASPLKYHGFIQLRS